MRKQYGEGHILEKCKFCVCENELRVTQQIMESTDSILIV